MNQNKNAPTARIPGDLKGQPAGKSSVPEPPDLVCLGQISGAHGVRGAVRIQTFTDHPDDISAYGPLQTEAGDRHFPITVQRQVKAGVIARIGGVDDRDAALALKGTRLFVARSALPSADDDEFYYVDLVGLKAVGADGRPFGEIIAVDNFGAGDVLELKMTASGETIHVPFTREVVPDIDLAGGRARVELPDGLGENPE